MEQRTDIEIAWDPIGDTDTDTDTETDCMEDYNYDA